MRRKIENCDDVDDGHIDSSAEVLAPRQSAQLYFSGLPGRSKHRRLRMRLQLAGLWIRPSSQRFRV